MTEAEHGFAVGARDPGLPRTESPDNWCHTLPQIKGAARVDAGFGVGGADTHSEFRCVRPRAAFGMHPPFAVVKVGVN